MTSPPITLLGEEIAGEWNEMALAHIAGVFGGDYLPYVDGEMGGTGDGETDIGHSGSVLSCFEQIFAAENGPGARDVYGFRPMAGVRTCLLMGNEAKGLRRRTRKQAHATIEIPLVSCNINCLNVAAAAAVLLYYLTMGDPLALKRRTLAAIQKQRPDLLLVSGPDAMELGSVIRSACAFGWEHIFLHDLGHAWFDCDRIIKSEGRGTARRGRNPIKVIPFRAEQASNYRRIVVFTTEPSGKRPQSLSLADPNTLIVLTDEKETAARWHSDTAQEVVYVSLPSISPDAYHYRQAASIALAETARQLGQPEGDGIYLQSKKQRFRKEIEAEPSTAVLDLMDLLCF